MSVTNNIVYDDIVCNLKGGNNEQMSVVNLKGGNNEQMSVVVVHLCKVRRLDCDADCQ